MVAHMYGAELHRLFPRSVHRPNCWKPKPSLRFERCPLGFLSYPLRIIDGQRA
jgi:hypothetical protein